MPLHGLANGPSMILHQNGRRIDGLASTASVGRHPITVGAALRANLRFRSRRVLVSVSIAASVVAKRRRA